MISIGPYTSVSYARMSDQVTHDLLVRELSKVSEWDVLGIYLGLDESEIKEIELDHQSTARRRIVMLEIWTKKDVDASWEKVIEALKSMSQIVLAKQLEEKYCTSESNSLATAACPRTKFIHVKELLLNRKEAIVCRIEDLEEKFLLLVTKVESAMTEADPSPMKLKRFSKFYGNAKVTTVEELLDLLEPFYFLDYALLEKIVKFFLSSSEVVDDLRDYLQQVSKFQSSTTVREFMESIERAQQSHSATSERPGLCTVKLRLVGGWLTKTMEDLEKLVNEIFKDKVDTLSHLRIVRGSVIVTYCAPLSEAESLTVLLVEQSSFVVKVGVYEIVVGDTMVVQSDSTDFSFESSLLDAVEENNLNLLSFLLNINTSSDTSNDKALLYGSYLNRDKAISLLLKANANPNIQTITDNATPLFIASQEGHTDTVALLLKANASPNVQRDDGTTALFIASQNGHTDIVSFLLKANANPNLQCDDGKTPLYIASQQGHIDIVSFLLKANANPNLPKVTGATPLFIASQRGCIDTITLLLSANADPNLQGCIGATPIYIASQKGHTEAVALLLKANANPNFPCNNGTTPIYVASQNGHPDTVTTLLKANANANLQCESGATPLYIASELGHIDVVALLLKANADPNLQCDNGATPLLMATQNGHTDTVALLLKANANPNLQCDDGTTPLFIASQLGHTAVVALLLKANGNPNLQIRNGATPLFVASQNGHSDTVNLLLKSNANPNIHHDKGTTPLMTAALNAHTQVVQLLLASGADPNLQGCDGLSALMIASSAGYLDSVELLLKYDADLSIKSYGLTALDMAAKAGHENIVELLQTAQLSQSSTTSPVLTADEIASNVDNKTMALINRAMEQMLVKGTKSRITADYQKLKQTALPSKHYQEESHNIY